jgi:hypothetical protein
MSADPVAVRVFSGLKMHPFDEQSETIMVTVPELNIARTAVLDYWAHVQVRQG